MAYYSALYIPATEIKPITADPKAAARVQNSLQGALAKAKISPSQYNIPDLSKNITIMASTELIQRYATGAISKIISGEPITSKTVLDTLFNTYAPAFNGMLEQMGYNSIMQMKDAARAGTLNVPNFLNGFSTSLAVITDTFFNDSKKEKYGEEIPIDVVEKFEIEHKNNIAVHPSNEGVDITDYIKNFGEVSLKVFGHVLNSTAEFWSIGDYTNKINDAMLQKKPVVFRIGRTIYENVLIKSFKPSITNIYDINFELNLSYNHFLARESKRNKEGYHIINGSVNQEVVNMLATEEYIGEGKVESVPIEDMAMIDAMLDAIGLSKYASQ